MMMMITTFLYVLIIVSRPIYLFISDAMILVYTFVEWEWMGRKIVCRESNVWILFI